MVAATITPAMSFPSPYYHLSQQQSPQLLLYNIDYSQAPMMFHHGDKGHLLPSINLASQSPHGPQNPQLLTPVSSAAQPPQQIMAQSPMDYYYYPTQPRMSVQSKAGYSSQANWIPPYTMGYGNYLTEPYNGGSPTNENNKRQIDYSLLVSYTNSTVSRRRRRSSPPTSLLDMMYPCSQCGKVFQKLYNLKSHMRTHLREKPFACLVCGKTFARSHDMRRHQLLHEGKKNFKCEGFLKDGVTKWGCGRLFARSDALTRHFRTETGWMCIKPFMEEARNLGVYQDASQVIVDATEQSQAISTFASANTMGAEDEADPDYALTSIYRSSV